MSLLFLWAVPVRAAPAVQLSAGVGFGGWVVPGTITPLRVEVSARQPLEGVLTVEVPGATRASPAVTQTYPLRLASGMRQQLAFDVVVQDARRPVRLRLRSGGRDLAALDVPVGAAQVADGIVLALTHDPAGLQFLRAYPRKLRPAYVPEQVLPTRWQTYDGVALLVIRDLDPRALVPAQQRAVVDWVVQGGRLLVVARDGATIADAPWLVALLPATIEPLSSAPAAVPVSAVRLRPRPRASVVAGQPPLAVRWRYGRGIVEVWAFDAFAPAVRAWPGRLQFWQRLIDVPAAPPIAGEELAAHLPQTRPLAGTTQVALAVLSVVYIVVMRRVLVSLGAARGGWLGITGTIAVSGVVLYAFASGARAGAASLAQVSIAESLPGVPYARVTSYVSLISPYGGRFSLVPPDDGVIRPLTPAAVTLVEPDHVATGTAGPGQLTFEVRQVVSIDLRAAARADGTLQVTVRTGRALRGAMLYRRRQVYRLPEVTRSLQLQLDPVRWEAAPRSLRVGGDVADQAIEWLTRRLDRADGDLWLVGFVSDDRLASTLADGRAGQVVQILVTPVEVR